MSQTFELIYNGSVSKGFELDQVKQNVARLYKTEVAKIERLFCGELVVIKTDLDRDTALKYQAAMKKAGAEVAIRPKQVAAPAAEAPAPAAAPAAPTQTTEPVTTQTAPPAPADDGGITIAEPGVQIVEHEIIPEPDINISAISMAEVGADVTDPVVVEAAPVPDTSDMSMAEAGVQIVEHEPVPELDIDVSNISMAEVGADVTDPVAVEAAPIPDTSDISMAEPGAQIVEHEPVPEPDIDISALKVEENNG